MTKLTTTFTFITANIYDETYINKSRIVLIGINEEFSENDTKYILNEMLHGDLNNILCIHSIDIEIPIHELNRNYTINENINNYIEKEFNLNIFIDIYKKYIEYLD